MMFGGGSVELFWFIIFDFWVYYVVYFIVIWVILEVGGCIFYFSMLILVESLKGLVVVNWFWMMRKCKVEIYSEYFLFWNLDWLVSEFFLLKFIYFVFFENIIYWFIVYFKDDLIEFYWIGMIVLIEMWFDEEYCWWRWLGGIWRLMIVFSII